MAEDKTIEQLIHRIDALSRDKVMLLQMTQRLDAPCPPEPWKQNVINICTMLLCDVYGGATVTTMANHMSELVDAITERLILGDE